MNTQLSVRYTNEALAWEYDQRQPSPFPGEAEWYVKHAGPVRGPLLELTCGSGRLTLSLAKEGFDIDGVDSSQTMLRRLADRLKECDTASARRIRTFCADMLTFESDRRYSTVLVPYNSLEVLETVDRIRRLFARVPGFLTKDGRFLFVVRRIQHADYEENERTAVDWMDKPAIDERTGLSVASRILSRYDPASKRIADHRFYSIKRSDGREQNIDFITYAPVITIAEYVSMLEDSGFAASVSGGYGDPPDDGVSKEVCFSCRWTG